MTTEAERKKKKESQIPFLFVVLRCAWNIRIRDRIVVGLDRAGRGEKK